MSSNTSEQQPVVTDSARDNSPESFWAELVEERVKMLMERAAPQQRRYKTLEKWTGVPSDRWSAVALGRQRPTAEMLGALCRQFNGLTLWLMTGRDDPRNKQWNLETFFARKELRLSDILEKPPGSDLSWGEVCVLTSSWQLAKSLKDSERLESKRSVTEIDRLLESIPQDPSAKVFIETPAWLPLPDASRQEAPSSPKVSSAPRTQDKAARAPKKKQSPRA